MATSPVSEQSLKRRRAAFPLLDTRFLEPHSYRDWYTIPDILVSNLMVPVWPPSPTYALPAENISKEFENGSDNAPSFCNLPRELHHMILKKLDHEDVISLGLTSRYFMELARRHFKLHYRSFMGTWAGKNIVSLKDRILPDDSTDPFSALKLDDINPLQDEAHVLMSSGSQVHLPYAVSRLDEYSVPNIRYYTDPTYEIMEISKRVLSWGVDYPHESYVYDEENSLDEAQNSSDEDECTVDKHTLDEEEGSSNEDNYVNEPLRYRVVVLKEASVRYQRVWYMLDAGCEADWFPKDQTWILRNLTTKQYVYAKAVAQVPERIYPVPPPGFNEPDKNLLDWQQIRDKGTDNALDYVKNSGIGKVIMQRTCWSADGKIRGAWAGHRLDITTLEKHESDPGRGKWVDISDEIVEEARMVLKRDHIPPPPSLIGSGFW